MSTTLLSQFLFSFLLMVIAIAFTFLSFSYFAFEDVTNALTFLHGVVAIVVWLCLNTTAIVPSSQGLDCSVLLWLSIGQSLCKCVILIFYVHHGPFFWGSFRQIHHFCKILAFVAFRLFFSLSSLW